MASKFTLYRAIDKRDGSTNWWLHRENEEMQIAQFSIKTAPSRIKHRSLAAPDNIVWNGAESWKHAKQETAELVDHWEGKA